MVEFFPHGSPDWSRSRNSRSLHVLRSKLVICLTLIDFEDNCDWGFQKSSLYLYWFGNLKIMSSISMSTVTFHFLTVFTKDTILFRDCIRHHKKYFYRQKYSIYKNNAHFLHAHGRTFFYFHVHGSLVEIYCCWIKFWSDMDENNQAIISNVSYFFLLIFFVTPHINVCLEVLILREFFFKIHMKQQLKGGIRYYKYNSF